MALSGQAKAEYQREYMRRKRNAVTAKPSVVACCDFCGEDGSHERLLVQGPGQVLRHMRKLRRLGGRHRF